MNSRSTWWRRWVGGAADPVGLILSGGVVGLGFSLGLSGWRLCLFVISSMIIICVLEADIEVSRDR